jgi:hypothetical protein
MAAAELVTLRQSIYRLVYCTAAISVWRWGGSGNKKFWQKCVRNYKQNCVVNWRNNIKVHMNDAGCSAYGSNAAIEIWQWRKKNKKNTRLNANEKSVRGVQIIQDKSALIKKNFGERECSCWSLYYSRSLPEWRANPASQIRFERRNPLQIEGPNSCLHLYIAPLTLITPL